MKNVMVVEATNTPKKKKIREELTILETLVLNTILNLLSTALIIAHSSIFFIFYLLQSDKFQKILHGMLLA